MVWCIGDNARCRVFVISMVQAFFFCLSGGFGRCLGVPAAV